MGLTKEEQQLIVTVTGRDDVERLTVAYNAEEATLRQLIEAKKSGTISDAAYDAQVKRTTAGMVANAAGMNKAKVAVGEYRQNLMGLSYTLNDFFAVQGNLQQRLNAIANNMPMLLAGFGGWGLALSAILPILGALLPALFQLAKSLGFEESIKLGISGIDHLKAKLEELEKNPPKLSMDLDVLQAAKRELDALQKNMGRFEQGKKTMAAEDLEGNATKAVRSTIGSDALAKAIGEGMIASGDKSAIPQKLLDEKDEQQKTIETHEWHIEQASALVEAHKASGEMGKQWMAQARVEMNKEGATRAKADLETTNRQISDIVAGKAAERAGQFMSGDVAAVASVKNLADRSPGAFDKDFRKQLGQLPSSPEQVEAIRQVGKSEKKDADDQDNAKHQLGELKDQMDKQVKRVMDITKRAEDEEDARLNRVSTAIDTVLDNMGDKLRDIATKGIAENNEGAAKARIQALTFEPLDKAGVSRDSRNEASDQLTKRVMAETREKLEGGEPVAPFDPKQMAPFKPNKGTVDARIQRTRNQVRRKKESRKIRDLNAQGEAGERRMTKILKKLPQSQRKKAFVPPVGPTNAVRKAIEISGKQNEAAATTPEGAALAATRTAGALAGEQRRVRAADGGTANTERLIGIAERLAQMNDQTLQNQQQQARRIQQLGRHVGHSAETFQNSGGPGG